MTGGVVALVCRLSPRPDDKYAGVEAQERAGRKYAADRWPGLPVEVFADRGISASNGDQRPGLDRFREWLADGRISHVWAVEQSRVSRETDGRYPWFTLAAEMDVAGVIELHTNRDGIVRVQDAVAGIKAVLAKDEARKIRQRTRDAKDDARAAGNMRTVLGGPPPLGYRNGRDDWEPEPGAALLLRDVAARVLADPEHVIRAAYEGAMREPRHREVRDAKGRPVNERMIRQAFKRPATAGLLTARDDPETVVGRMTDAALPVETWRELRQVFTGRKRIGRRVSAGTYWAGPALECGNCTNRLTGEKVYYRGQQIPYYACRNPHPRLGITKPCRGVSVRAADAHRVLQAAVEGWAAGDADFAAATRMRGAQTGERDRLAAELAGVRERFSRVTQQWARGDVTDSLYAEIEAEKDVTVARLGGELAGLTEALAAPVVPADVEWETLSGAAKLELVKLAVVTPVRVAPGNGGGAALAAEQRMTMLPR